MIKSPLVILAAILAVATMFASTAQAGFKIRLGFGGPLPAFNAYGNGGGYSHRHYSRKRYYARRVVKKEKVYVAKKKAEPKVAAKKDKPEKVAAKPVVKKPVSVASASTTEPEVIADTENSSIAAALEQPAIAPTALKVEEAVQVQPATTSETPLTPETTSKPTKAASKLDCKKFFPSVGMTLTVPCE